jgi:uncharacterized protein
MSDTENRGFASMDDEEQREIASKGGKAAHASGHAHEFSSEEAREAGRKGGEAVSQDRQHMSEIGQQGGQRSSGGTHEQHVRAGEQSHKNTSGKNMSDDRISPAQLEKYLKGASYPTNKEQLIQLAQKNSAPDEIVQKLRSLSGDRFETTTDVTRAFGQS